MWHLSWLSIILHLTLTPLLVILVLTKNLCINSKRYDTPHPPPPTPHPPKNSYYARIILDLTKRCILSYEKRDNIIFAYTLNKNIFPGTFSLFLTNGTRVSTPASVAVAKAWWYEFLWQQNPPWHYMPVPPYPNTCWNLQNLFWSLNPTHICPQHHPGNCPTLNLLLGEAPSGSQCDGLYPGNMPRGYHPTGCHFPRL